MLPTTWSQNQKYWLKQNVFKSLRLKCLLAPPKRKLTWQWKWWKILETLKSNILPVKKKMCNAEKVTPIEHGIWMIHNEFRQINLPVFFSCPVFCEIPIFQHLCCSGRNTHHPSAAFRHTCVPTASSPGNSPSGTSTPGNSERSLQGWSGCLRTP